MLQQVDARDQSFVQKAAEDNENQLVGQLAELVNSEQFDEAAMLIASTPKAVNRSANGSAEVQRLKTQVGEAIRKQIDSDLRIGRLDRAMSSLAKIERAGIDGSQAIGLRSHIRQLSQIVSDARAADYAMVLRKLKLLKQVFPAAKWIDDAITATEKCTAAVEEIFSGPLGFMDCQQQELAQSRPRTTNHYSGKEKQQTTTRSSLLHVDQLGSLLVLPHRQVTIGTTSSSGNHTTGGAADVVLQTEGGSLITIQRSGEDYLAQSAKPFVVNDRSTRQHLLSNGDAIEVGKRGRLKFVKSVSASNSAVLKITGCKMKQRQIRSIVLLGDSLVFGPTFGHFRLAGLKRRVIIRPITHLDAFVIHQQGRTGTQTLALGTVADFDGYQFTHQRSVS